MVRFLYDRPGTITPNPPMARQAPMGNRQDEIRELEKQLARLKGEKQ